MVCCVEIGKDNVPYIQVGNHQLRLDLEDLDEEYKKRAREELGETQEVAEKALHELRQFIEDESDLHVPLDDDKFLLKFLRTFKYDSEKAFNALKKFYKFKSKYPKYGANVTPNAIKHVFDNEVFVFLPTRTPTGSRVMLLNVGTKWNPKVVSVRDMFKSILVATEIAMMEPKTQVGGVHVIINMEGFSLTHVYQFSPSEAKLIVEWVQDHAPVSLHGIHIINQSIFFNMAFAIFKPFLREKLKKKLYFHGTNRNALHNEIGSATLPESMGGTGSFPDYPGKLLSEMFFYYEELFERLNNYCYTNDKLKPVNEKK